MDRVDWIEVCRTCGNPEIEEEAWAKTNYDHVVSNMEAGGSTWCGECEEHDIERCRIGRDMKCVESEDDHDHAFQSHRWMRKRKRELKAVFDMLDARAALSGLVARMQSEDFIPARDSEGIALEFMRRYHQARLP